MKMPEIADKVESNVKARVDATRDVFSKEVTTVKDAAKDVLALKPVKGIVDLVANTIDNLGDFVKEQAEITRKWVG